MRARAVWFRRLRLLALLAATSACTDGAGPPATPFGLEVTLVPATLSLGVGQTGQFVAVVSGGAPGSARAVTWSSSNAALVAVDSLGRVEVLRAPQPGEAGEVTILATASTDANARGAGLVKVTTAPSIAPAAAPTITIAGITAPGGAEVDVARMAGLVNVLLDVEAPGAVPESRIEVLLDARLGCAQTLSHAAPAAVGAAAAGVLRAICPLDTGAFDTLTGVVAYGNGPHQLRARLATPNGTTLVETGAAVVLANLDRLRVELASSRGPAADAAGRAWRGGDVSVRVRPVIFSGTANAVARAAVSLTTGGRCDAGGAGCGARTILRAAGADAAGAFVARFPGDSALAANGAAGLEDSAFVTVTTVTASGQAGPGFNDAAAGFAPGAVAYIDNVAPRIVSFAVPDGGFVGPDFAFGATTGCPTPPAVAPVATPCFRAVDDGSGARAPTFMAGRPGALRPAATGAALPEVNPPGYVVQATVSDAVGNATSAYATPDAALPTTDSTKAAHFGVDLTAPSLSISGPSSGGTQRTLGGAYVATASDEAAGLPAEPIRARQVLVRPGARTCVAPPSANDDGSCGFGVVAGAVPLPLEEGYDSTSFYAVDIVGNRSAAVTRVLLQDPTPPRIYELAGPPSITGGQLVFFDLAASDNLDLGQVRLTEGFGGLLRLNVGSTIGLGTYGPAEFTTDARVRLPVGPIAVSVEPTSSSGVPTGAVQPATDVTVSLTDIAGNVASRPLGIAASVPQATTPFAARGVASFTLQRDSLAGALVATVTAAAGTVASPFARIDFYRLDGGAYTLLGSATVASVLSDDTTRRIIWRAKLGSSGFAPGGLGLIALGVDAAGRALRAAAVP